MTREELVNSREYEICMASDEYWRANTKVSPMTAFEDGAHWADEHPQNPWISVEDRLPEYMKDVLMVSNYGDLNEFHVACLLPEGFWITSDCKVIEEGCFKWMPIPPIEKGGTE